MARKNFQAAQTWDVMPSTLCSTRSAMVGTSTRVAELPPQAVRQRFRIEVLVRRARQWLAQLSAPAARYLANSQLPRGCSRTRRALQGLAQLSALVAPGPQAARQRFRVEVLARLGHSCHLPTSCWTTCWGFHALSGICSAMAGTAVSTCGTISSNCAAAHRLFSKC